ncbi:MAG: hypothetical protein RBR35_17425 [Salinivirgaceae bacterium]|nr:hypothetical protein [Salinivirgaceae bacterium]
MIDCVFRFAELETFIAKMAALEVATRDAVDAEGAPCCIEQRVGAVMTPPLTTALKEQAVCVRLTEEQAALIPNVTSPEFLCDWRSDEVMDVEEVAEDGSIFVHEQPLPWPTYEIPTCYVDGQLSGTRMQGCGRIA